MQKCRQIVPYKQNHIAKKTKQNKKMILCAKMAFLNTTKMIGHVKTFLLHICPELCDMYILYYYYYEITKKTNYEFTIKKHNQVELLCYHLLHKTYDFFPSPIFFYYNYPYDQFNLITQTEPNSH